ncbi:MAG: putative lipoprotein [Ilumatobacteraceae bacterium]|nr:putative lipoprotein [Ilumatobacteraceae bacterium]
MTDDPTTPHPHLPHLPPPPPAPVGPARVRTTPTLSAAWLAVGSLAAVVGLLYSTFQVVGVLAHEEREETVRVTDPAVTVLDVASQGGTIEVVGADVDDVRIDAHVSDGMVATRFTHEVVGDRLQVRVRCRLVLENQWCSADLRIVIPRDLEVKVRSTDDSVSLRGLSGRVDAESDNASVEAESLSGATRLHSDNGSVRASRLATESIQADSSNGSVRIEFATAPLSAIASSDNGSVEVAVPRGDEGYAVDISSGNGSTDNLVTSDPASERRIVATSSNGSVTVRYLD